jgi:hypothetical protein
VNVTFPFAVELTGVAIHSQHSGRYHAARAVRVAVQDAPEQIRQLVTVDLKSVDEIVSLPKTAGRIWRFDLQAGDSGCVVLRGLQFYAGDDELFPPLVPWTR